MRRSSGYGVSFWGDENVLELDRGGCCITLRMCQMPQKCSLRFMLCEFHKLNLDKRSREGTEWSLKINLSEELLLSRWRTGKAYTFVRIVCKVKYICMTSISTV